MIFFDVRLHLTFVNHFFSAVLVNGREVSSGSGVENGNVGPFCDVVEGHEPFPLGAVAVNLREANQLREFNFY